ncbi:hypothetical protein MBLNU459_g7775t3 [Dothideomycetes sp. NU459]
MTASYLLPRAIFNAKFYSNVLHLWFDGLPATATGPSPEIASRWFSKDPIFDAACKNECSVALDALAPGKIHFPTTEAPFQDGLDRHSIAKPLVQELEGKSGDEWVDTALALVLLLDQMPRNIFRDRQALIYTHYDRLARAFVGSTLETLESTSQTTSLLQHMLAQSSMLKSPARRIWFYLPLMHSESTADHDLFLSCATQMRADIDQHDESALGFAKSIDSFEQMHRDILDRFGRYPHRNEMIGRETTAEEQTWLDGGGQRFGSA